MHFYIVNRMGGVNLHRLVQTYALVQVCTMFKPQEIFEALEARRKELHLSQAEVGARAFGVADNSAFQALRRGSAPAADKLEALCRAVGWEFYFGPPREQTAAQPSLPAKEEFASIAVHSAALAAGGGAENHHVEVIDHLTFRRDWLTRIGVSAAQAVLAHASGESMLPIIHPGDMLLIDQAQREIRIRQRGTKAGRPPPIYAIRDGGTARVKRIHRPESKTVILLSDNPVFPPEILTGPDAQRLDIIGKVVWWAHTNRE